MGSRDEQAFQHRGLGSSLLEAMEKEARESFDARTLLVMSAVGTRNYYRKFGYERSGPVHGQGSRALAPKIARDVSPLRRDHRQLPVR